MTNKEYNEQVKAQLINVLTNNLPSILHVMLLFVYFIQNRNQFQTETSEISSHNLCQPLPITSDVYDRWKNLTKPNTQNTQSHALVCSVTYFGRDIAVLWTSLFLLEFFFPLFCFGSFVLMEET